jgi:hypothetical protein
MRRIFAILGSVLFFVVAPGTVARLVPWWIARRTAEVVVLRWLPLRLLGTLLAGAGFLLYVAVVGVIAGQGLILGNVAVLLYGTSAWLCCHLFVLGYEKRPSQAGFGSECEQFCANVPRWIPRPIPWQASRATGHVES